VSIPVIEPITQPTLDKCMDCEAESEYVGHGIRGTEIYDEPRCFTHYFESKRCKE